MTQDPTASSLPTPPTVVTAERLAARNVRLRWTGPVGDGTRYQVWRQLDGESAFTQLGREVAGSDDGGIGGGAGIHANTFTDTNVKHKTEVACYYVVTLRPDGAPATQSDVVTVNLIASEAA